MALAGSLRSGTFVSCRSSRVIRVNSAPARALKSGSASSHVVRSSPADVTPSPEPAAAVPADTAPSTSESPAKEDQPEVVFYEGDGGSNTELALSILLAGTVLYAPLTMASIGRRLWLKYRFTNKRIVITNTSPLFKGEVQIPYSQIKEVRAVARAFGAWGDMVVFLKNGQRVEFVGMEKYQDLKAHIERCMWTL